MIAIDLQTFQQSPESGSVTGGIHLELADGAFPEAGWSDFPVTILCWWADALLHLEGRTGREVQWRFMDGPYSVRLTRVTPPVSVHTFEFSQVHNSLIEVAERVLAHCDQHSLSGKDLDVLRANVGRLKTNRTVQRPGSSGSAHIEIRPTVATGSPR